MDTEFHDDNPPLDAAFMAGMKPSRRTRRFRFPTWLRSARLRGWFRIRLLLRRLRRVPRDRGQV
ncbi:hypothetical protein J4558_01100 [Leptolyngbya sp. 15MV]|nr:hypothetical protein J4558_01100 [Leptolyngbya sp. 15MV]